MSKQIFTFWEGQMPDYIRLCMETWKVPYIKLDYDNVKQYTDIDLELVKRFSLAQIADYVRVHVLRDNGGHWLDADTIMITDNLPTTNMIGEPHAKINTIGYLYSEPHSKFFMEWAEYQDDVARNPNASHHWSVMGNAFTDPYVKQHPEVTICDVRKCWPETYMIDTHQGRYEKYLKFYFDDQYHLFDIEKTDMLMLHNSWTPAWYKKLTADEVISGKCTMSNFLREVLR